MAQSVPPGGIATQPAKKVASINDRPGKMSKKEDLKKEVCQEPIPSEEKFNHRLAARFIDQTLERGVNGLAREFRMANYKPDSEQMKEFQQQERTGRNRFSEVGCLDKTRVHIALGQQGYIHANYVSGFVNRKRFICTQAPLFGTIADFWYMVAQEECPAIVMLCNFKEQGIYKCTEYFPPSIAKCVQVEDIKVFCIGMGKYRFRSSTNTVVMRRVLEICIPNRRPHRCTHLQWIGWPARGVPQVDQSMIEISHFIDNLSSTLMRPVVVHCSAGVGTTGSFVLMDSLLETMKFGLRLDASVLPALKLLRAQRAGAVQNDLQYLYVHQVMLNYIINFLLDKSERKQYLERFAKFTADYEEAAKDIYRFLGY